MTVNRTATRQILLHTKHFWVAPTVRIPKAFCLSKTDLPLSTLFREGGQSWSAKRRIRTVGEKVRMNTNGSRKD